jgi:hypothetical protein
VTDLLRGGFIALGHGPTHDELDAVARVLRQSEDPETRDLLDRAYQNEDDGEAFEEVCRIAEASNSGGLVALDLVVVVALGVEALTRSGKAAASPS